MEYFGCVSEPVRYVGQSYRDLIKNLFTLILIMLRPIVIWELR